MPSTTVKTEEVLLMKNGTVEAGEPMLLMKALRIVRGLSGTKISSSSGIDRSRLSVLELAGDRLRPHEREKLARVLSVSLEQVDQPVRLFVEIPTRREVVAAQPVRRRPARSEVVAASR